MIVIDNQLGSLDLESLAVFFKGKKKTKILFFPQNFYSI